MGLELGLSCTDQIFLPGIIVEQGKGGVQDLEAQGSIEALRHELHVSWS